MDNNPRYIHETVLKDVIELVSDYVKDPDKLLTKFGQSRIDNNDGIGYMRNIARSSRGLTLEFPVIVSDMVQVDNAVMVSKAIERKAVAMLQMLFSAISITNAKDAISYIKKFHTNLTTDGNIGVDDFVDLVDGMAANEAFHVDEKQFKAVLEDFKNCTNYYLADSIRDKSLNEYSVDMDSMTVHDYPVKNEDAASKIFKGIKKIRFANKIDNMAKTSKEKYANTNMAEEGQVVTQVDSSDTGKNDASTTSRDTNTDKQDNYPGFIDRKKAQLKSWGHNQVAATKQALGGHFMRAYDTAHGIGPAAKTANDYLGVSHANEEYDFDNYDDEIAFYEDYVANNLDDDDDEILTEGIATHIGGHFAKRAGKYVMKKAGHAAGSAAAGAIGKQILSTAGKYVEGRMNKSKREYDPGNNAGDLKDYSDYLKNRRSQFTDQQFSTDIKKANEMVPSMMVIQFTSVGADGQTIPIDTTAVIGVKARLHYVTSKDMMDRIATKNEDKNGLFNFIKATTRQISFWKDFVFAIDKAKLNAIASSGRGTSSPIWRLLENRALRSKIRRWTGSINDAAAISTLVITRDEAEYLKKEYNLDLSRPGAVYPIMNAYNIMCFVIVDEPLERIDFLFDDGTNQYETLSFMHLEREDGGGQYKKIINLLAKSR